jgi:(S)-2-hydroxy-acid oxidase
MCIVNSLQTEHLLRRVEACGDYKAIVLTVDTPYFGKRRDDERNAFALPKHLVCDFKSSLFDLPLVILAEWQISRITMR